MSGWVVIAAVAMEKSGLGQMGRPGSTTTGLRASPITLGESKLIYPSILTIQAIGTTTLHLTKSHLYVLTKVSKQGYPNIDILQFSCSLSVRVEIFQWLLLQVCF